MSVRRLFDTKSLISCQYSIYVLESSTSRRLTYALPPLNLFFLLLRPLRLVLASEDVRRVRIVVLKATHMPFVALIWTYESSRRLFSRNPPSSVGKAPLSLDRPFKTSIPSPHAQRDSARASSSRAELEPTSMSSDANPIGAATKCASCSVLNKSDDLAMLVQELMQKVDDLTALVAGQQE